MKCSKETGQDGAVIVYSINAHLRIEEKQSQESLTKFGTQTHLRRGSTCSPRQTRVVSRCTVAQGVHVDAGWIKAIPYHN